MIPAVIMAIIGLVSGGGLTALLKIMIDHSQNKRTARDKEIDDRILAWQKISEKTESRVERLEQKLESYERDFRSLERYIQALEHTILRAAPPLDLPARPILERETILNEQTPANI
ncbi:MAG: hypothetical protein LBT44_04750 [Clostridiales bacterium]|nr:hypothetical protein [Clostridiales bacterium]